jgi:hypothetical protein
MTTAAYMFVKSKWRYMANVLDPCSTPYVGVKNQNCHENGPPKIRPKNKKGNLLC